MLVSSMIAKYKIDLTFFKFVAVGLINTLLSLIIIFLLKYFFEFTDVKANLIGYLAGLLCSFMLNKKWTFNHDGQWVLTAFKFTIVFAVAYFFNIKTVLFFIDNGINSYLSHMIGMPIYTIIFYLGSRFFVFR